MVVFSFSRTIQSICWDRRKCWCFCIGSLAWCRLCQYIYPDARTWYINEHIVFDSPVKTRKEIEYCHEHLPGIILNANSLEELDRYPTGFTGKLGLRINPLTNSDAPDIFNVSGIASKFGVPISRSAAIVQACVSHTQVTGLHLHVGSGIRDYEANLTAINKLIALAHKINLERKSNHIPTKIEFIDIGGGIDFSTDTGPHSVADFVQRLRTETPLFNEFRVMTEYGKYVHTDAGFVVSNIEYVLEGADKEQSKTAFIHVGADLFVRKIYSELPIQYPYSVIRFDGDRSSDSHRYNIAGPLCFSGDFMYKDIVLKELTEQDKFVIQRTGANTLSMWSHHCNRKVPKLVLV